jgi:CBS domain-containing protein
VIRRNMRELVDLLVSDADMLPCEAAEHISIQRAVRHEADRTAADLMVDMPTIAVSRTVREAAGRLVESNSPILAVLSQEGELVGVLTDWDVTQAAARGAALEDCLDTIMTSQVVAASPEDRILELIRKLEGYSISAMPVGERGCVLGMVSADLLARQSLSRLLLSQSEV